MLLAYFFQTGDYSFAKSDRVEAFVPGQASNFLPPPPQPNLHIPTSVHTAARATIRHR